MKYFPSIPVIMMRGLLTLVLASLLISNSASAVDRDRIETFLEVTGFDVALDSIAPVSYTHLTLPTIYSV